jgi:NADH-quinone oxidoreductase subunit L
VEHPSVALEVGLLAVSAAVALAGIYLAYIFYVKQPGLTDRIRARLGIFHRVASAGYYFDTAYDYLRQGFWASARFFADTIDQRGIDTAVNGIARGAGWLGERTRRLQTGLVGTYALTLFVGLVIVLAYFLITAVLR